jgi:hypothetical protein
VAAGAEEGESREGALPPHERLQTTKAMGAT